MSATLSDDSVLISNFDVEKDILKKSIVPKKASDIGDRMILYPQALNPEISDESLKNKLKELSEKYRVIVIVPSNIRANFWNDVADHIYTGESLNMIRDKTRFFTERKNNRNETDSGLFYNRRRSRRQSGLVPQCGDAHRRMRCGNSV